MFDAGTGGVVHTTDFDLLHRIAPRWAPEHFQLGHGVFSGGLKYGHTARMQFATKYWRPGLLIRGAAPARSVVLGFALTDQVQARHRGVELRPQQVALVRCGEAVDFRADGPYQLFLMAMSDVDVQLHAFALLGRSLDEITRGDRLNGKRSTPDRLWEVERLGLDALYENPARLNDPKVAAWVENKILDVMLSAVSLNGPRTHLPGAARLARRAEGYLIENLNAPLTIRDLCTAMGTMERTLHLAFRTHLGTTPKAHLKMLRLNAVRRGLKTAPAGTGVMDVAARWGFFHAGWFSQDYRQMFGESPSATLRSVTSRSLESRPFASVK
jgi:AraC family ethanolamine operon transcriptional activator